MNTENLPVFLEAVIKSALYTTPITLFVFWGIRMAKRDKKVKRMFDERDIYK